MKGYAYLDLDGNLVYKPQKYIEEINLKFWSQNQHLIFRKFVFDTNDRQSMLELFRKISDLQIQPDKVLSFCQSINFDITSLKSSKDEKSQGKNAS